LAVEFVGLLIFPTILHRCFRVLLYFNLLTDLTYYYATIRVNETSNHKGEVGEK